MKRNIILKTLMAAILGTAALQVQAQGIYVNKKNHESIAYPKSILDKVTPTSNKSSSAGSSEWTLERIADMNTARMGHQIFPSGNGFVVVGGHTTDFQLTTTAEIYQNGKWTNLSINNPHDGAFSVILDDGRVMVGGGSSSKNGVGQSKKTDIYNPATQAFTAGPDMTVERAYSKAVLMNGKVYVNGNWYADNKVMDCYDGTSFSAVGSMRNFTLPYIFASKNGTIWTWSLMDPWGKTIDWGKTSSGSQGLIFNEFTASSGETHSYLFGDLMTNVPLNLSEDVRMSNCYSAKDNCYYFLTKNSSGVYRLYYSLIDEDKIGWYNFEIPNVYPNSQTAIDYRGSVFVNDAKDEIYLIGSSGASTNQTIYLVCYNFSEETVVHRTITKFDGFEHNLMSGAWTMLNNGQLVCTGGGINSNFDAQKYAYIFTPPTSGSSGSNGENGVDVWKKDGTHDTYFESELESITTYEEQFDERISQEIPTEYLSRLSAYMPIYSGNTPPIIEGTYNLSPWAVVFDEAGYEPGHTFSNKIIRFSSQNTQQNTLVYDQKQSSSTGHSDNVVILGQGHNFTVFFIQEEKDPEFNFTGRAAAIYSGTMSDTGLINLYYGFLYLEKNDPLNKKIDVGKIRVIKDTDGISEPTSWSARLKAAPQVGNNEGTESESAAFNPKAASSIKTNYCRKEKAIE